MRDGTHFDIEGSFVDDDRRSKFPGLPLKSVWMFGISAKGPSSHLISIFRRTCMADELKIHFWRVCVRMMKVNAVSVCAIQCTVQMM